MQKPKIVYIAVDDDDYELPFAMGDTMRELAEEICVSTWDIWNCVKNRGRSTTPFNHTYRVEKVRLASDMEDILDFGTDRDIYNITINAYVIISSAKPSSTALLAFIQVSASIRCEIFALVRLVLIS